MFLPFSNSVRADAATLLIVDATSSPVTNAFPVVPEVTVLPSALVVNVDF